LHELAVQVPFEIESVAEDVTSVWPPKLLTAVTEYGTAWPATAVDDVGLIVM
jgi:hypothetical protein